jgi:hypothetical protein
MTTKEKAIELVAKYKSQSFGITTNFQHYKQCALITVDEILDNFPNEFWDEYLIDNFKYWQEVKKEIEAL